MPRVLNGVPLSSWSAPQTSEGWASVPVQLKFDEPAFACPAGKKEAAGVVTIEPDGRVWVSVHEREGYEGFKGAPCIVYAWVELLAHPRGSQMGRPE